MTVNYGWAIPSLAGAADFTATVAPPMNAIDATVKAVENLATAVPTVGHARCTVTGTLAISATTWTTVPLAGWVDASVGAPYSLASNVVTVTQSGVHLLSASVSATLSTFAIRISVGTNVVCVTPVGSGASLTSSVDRGIRITAGQVVKVEIYATVGMTISADAAVGPCSLTLTQLGL